MTQIRSRRTCSLVFGVVALSFVPAVAAAQDVPAAPRDSGGFRGWQVEGHIGAISSGSMAGSATLPAAGPAFTTVNGLNSRYVPSWYFGDGSLLANQVAGAMANQPPRPIVPLDPVLTGASATRPTGFAFGFRAGHSVTRRALVECSLDTDQAQMAIGSSALSAIESTRASFVSYFNSILARNPNAANVSTTAASSIVNNTGTEGVVTADVNIAILTSASFTPYVTVGAGVALPRGTQPSVTLVGSYSFVENLPGTRVNGAPIDESDRLLARYNVRAAGFLLAGGGVQRALSRHAGFRADVRFYPKASNMTVRVDTSPLDPNGTPSGHITRGPGPQIQISTTPGVPSSLSLQGINHVDTFVGQGRQASVTAGVYLRF